MCGSANWYNKPNNVTSIWTWGFSMPWSIVGFKWEFLAPFCCPRLCALVSYPIKWVLCTCNLAKGSSVKWTISALLSHVALCHYLVKYLIPYLKGLLSFCMFNVQFRLNNQIVRQTDVNQWFYDKFRRWFNWITYPRLLLMWALFGRRFVRNYSCEEVVNWWTSLTPLLWNWIRQWN